MPVIGSPAVRLTNARAYKRRHAQDQAQRDAPRESSRTVSWVFAGVVIALIVGTIYVTTLAPPMERFTEFYLLDAEGAIAAYPLTLRLGDNALVIIGITNKEGKPITYTVEILLENVTQGVLTDIALTHDTTYEVPYTFSATTLGENMRLAFHLYKNSETSVYLDTYVWVTVQAN